MLFWCTNLIIGSFYKIKTKNNKQHQIKKESPQMLLFSRLCTSLNAYRTLIKKHRQKFKHCSQEVTKKSGDHQVHYPHKLPVISKK